MLSLANKQLHVNKPGDLIESIFVYLKTRLINSYY